MAEYIERESFLADKKWLYCTDCDKRKGKKRGKMMTLYEIGEAPCKSCGIHDMLEEVEAYPAADVAPVKRGEWRATHERGIFSHPDSITYVCSECGNKIYTVFGMPRTTNFCWECGADMREVE